MVIQDRHEFIIEIATNSYFTNPKYHLIKIVKIKNYPNTCSIES